jgi:uracil-DNA glycosylase family 4
MGEDHTLQSVSLEFIRTIRDFSQYISHQNALGNTNLTLSKECRETMNTWGTQREKAAPFLFQGPETAALFFVDSDGSFFNGEPGGLLVKILKAMHLNPGEVFICNAPDLRSIHTRIKKIRPKIVITLGQRAGRLLLNLKSPLEQFQGKFHSYNGVPVMPTLHPSVLLAQPGLKRKVWEDMQQVMHRAGLSK